MAAVDSTDARPEYSVRGVPEGTEHHVPQASSSKDSVDSKLSRMSLESTVPDRYRYRMDHKKRGLFIIINNKTFLPQTGMNERSGTDVDAKNLYTDFKKLGFDVKLYQNQTAAEMLQIMVKASKEDHRDSDCFGVAVLSHGDNSELFGVDTVLAVDRFVQPIKGCSSLAGKPKIFIFQACRGNELDSGIDTNDADIDDPNAKHKRIPLEADFLYAYSTVPGYFSWRNSAKGSWFVQALHKVLEEFQYKVDFVTLLTRVNYEVAYEFESNASQAHMNRKKQVPSVVSMLTKDLYFSQK